MTPNQRRLLLGFCVFVFLLALPPILLFSRGYRLAFSPVRFIRTGTLALQTHPTGAEIWVNGKDTRKKTPDAIGGLKAGRYRVEVRREGYATWAKTLEVFPDLQTWASQIVLVPAHLSLAPLIQGHVLEFALSPDGTTCVFRTGVNPGQLQMMKLEDGQGGEAKTLVDLMFLGDPARHELEEFQWSPDGRRLLFVARLARRWSEKLGTKTYLVADFETSTISPVVLPPAEPAPAPEPTPSPAPSAKAKGPRGRWGRAARPPAEPTPPPLPPAPPRVIGAAAWLGSSTLVAYSRGSLFEMRLPEGEVQPIVLPDPVLAFTPGGGDRIYYLSARGPVLRRCAVPGANCEDLMKIEEAELGQPAGETEEPVATLALLPRDQLLLQMRNGLLFVMDPVESSLHHVAEGVERAAVSPDGKKLAYATHYGLGVYYLDVTDTEPRKLPGSRTAITRSESRIMGFAWHRLGEHVFYAAGDNVVLAELDDRDDRNSPSLGSSRAAIWDLDYDHKRDILYLKRSRSKDPEGVFALKMASEGIPSLPLP